MLKLFSLLTLDSNDDEKTRISKILLPVIIFLGGTTLVIVLLAPIVHDQPRPLILSGIGLIAVCAGLIVMIKCDLIKAAAIILAAILWLFFTSIAVLGGGIRSTGFINYFIFIVVVGLLFGKHTGLFAAALCICSGIFLLFAESSGLIVQTVLPTTERSLIMTYSINYGMVALLLYLAKKYVDESLSKAQDSDSRYHRIFENSPIPLWEEDFTEVKAYIDRLKANGISDFAFYFTDHPEAVQECAKLVRVLDVNQSSVDLLGAKSKQEVFKCVSRILGVEAVDMFCEELIALAEGQTTFSSEAVHTTLKGETVHTVANIAIAPGCEKDWSKVFVSSLDITRKRRTEQVLQTLNDAALAVEEALTPAKLFETLGDSLHKLGYSCAVFLLNNEGNMLKVRYVNYNSKLISAALRLISVDLEEFEIPVDRVNIFKEIIHNRKTIIMDGTEPVKQMLSDREKGLVTRVIGILNMPKSIIAPLITEDDVIGLMSVLGNSLTVDDSPAITAFAHQLAAALRKASLMEDLDHSFKELASTQEQLLQSQKMDAVGKLAGGVAHDFNNLLTAIIGYTDILMRKQKADESSQNHLQEIRKAADRAATLTSQLLTFSRKQVLQPEILNLNTVVESMTEMLKRLIGEDVEFFTKLHKDLELVKADAGQIEQVLMNLSVNSRDAMPHGGTLTIKTENKTVSRGSNHHADGIPSGTYVCLSFSDTGSGMDNELKKRIFEPFFTTKKHGEGTGLGLSTVYGIVKQSGGYISVSSEPGQGSTFHIFLPLIEAGKGKTGDAGHASQDLNGSEHVLLVEDEEIVRNMIQDVLEKYGYHVTSASQADEAFTLCSEMSEPLHLMITDVVMPGKLSGHDLAERLSDMHPGAHVLYMSGYTENSIIGHGVLDPQLHFIQKPFTPAALLNKVREVLDAEV